jgi:hypothetical protein
MGKRFGTGRKETLDNVTIPQNASHRYQNSNIHSTDQARHKSSFSHTIPNIPYSTIDELSDL